MDVIIALVFISLTLVIAGLVFFFSRLVEGDFEHGVGRREGQDLTLWIRFWRRR